MQQWNYLIGYQRDKVESSKVVDFYSFLNLYLKYSNEWKQNVYLYILEKESEKLGLYWL